MSDPSRPLDVQAVHDDGSLVLRLQGDLDIATVPVLTEAIDELMSAHLRAVTLDLSELSFVAVAGLRLLTSVQRPAEAGGGRFAMTGVSDRVLRTIRLARFADLERAVTAKL